MIQKAHLKWNKRTPFKGAKRTKSPNEDKYQNDRWQKESKEFRNGKICARSGQHPKCKGTPDTTDHIRNPAIDKSVDFWDQTNWQVLCRSCHAAKSNKERSILKAKLS